jgi:DNA-binding LacI/PurR family transcriptional regulator
MDKNMSDTNNIKYKEIAEDILSQIKKGIYDEGQRLPSRNQLCKLYNISQMTAKRVQDGLETMGVAINIKGKGLFVQNKGYVVELDQNKVNSPKVDSIICFNIGGYKDKPKYYAKKIIAGIKEQCKKLGKSFEEATFDDNEMWSKTDIKDNTGIVIIATGVYKWMLPLVLRPTLKTVLIDNIFPASYCVLNDNYSGVSQLFDWLQTKNVKTVLLAAKHFSPLGIANRSERIYAAEAEAKRKKINLTVNRSGNFNELISAVKGKNKPDAIMFTCDTSAAKFKKMLGEKNIKNKVIVTGFDGWNNKYILQENITTVSVNYKAMGKKAVDIFEQNKLADWSKPEIERVPCKLVVKE